MFTLLALGCLAQIPPLPLCRQEIVPLAPLTTPNRPGLGLAADGDWIAVGDPLPFNGRGQVFLYEYDPVSDRHVHRQTLGPSFANDYEFGWDIAVDGDTLVIGSPSTLGAPVTNPGSAYVYRLVGRRWEEQQRIEPTVPEDNDRFGWAVAASEGRIAVSAPSRDFGFESGVGALFLFSEEPQGWVQEAQLVPDQPAGLVDDFGYDLDLDGATVAAPFADDPVDSRVVVFERDETTGTWSETARIRHYVGGVAIEGNLLVTGAVNPTVSSDSQVHTARRDATTGIWMEGALPPLDLDGAGRRLAIQDGRLVVGASIAAARRVRSYTEVNGAWVQDFEAQPLGETPTSNFAFGERIAVSSGYVVVAASTFGLFDVGRVFRFTPGCTTFGDVTCFQPDPNSTGQGGELYAIGSRSVADNDIVLVAAQLPANEMGLFLASRAGTAPVIPVGSEGAICLGGDIGRFAAPNEIRSSGPEGRFDLQLDLGAIPTSMQDVAVLAGETWLFQAWHRDGTSSRTSNFTDAIEITWE